MEHDMWTIVGIMILGLFIIYITTLVISKSKYSRSTVEGMENGSAGMASTYADTIKSEVVRLQDELLIPKYKKDYETVLLNLDDLFSLQMMQECTTIVQDKDKDKEKEKGANIRRLVDLKMAKDALDDIMNYVEKQ
jgi:hypothetical protein